MLAKLVTLQLTTMNAASHPPVEPPVARRRIYIALGLSILLVIAVLVGSKLLYSNAVHQPVALNQIEAPGANSQTCQDVVAAAPEKISDYEQVELVDPAPKGAAAWVKDTQNRVVLRCGMPLPGGFSELNTVEDHAGAKWVAVSDQAGSDNVTWYSVDRKEVLAVTAPSADEAVMDDFADVVKADPQGESKLAQSPLQALNTDHGADAAAASASCDKFFSALPHELDNLTLERPKDPQLQDIAVYTSPRREPVALRCGVAAPASYQPGVQIQQVDEVAWYHDDEADGSPTGIWYGLGFDQRVAMILPAGSGNTAISEVSTAMDKALTKTAD